MKKVFIITILFLISNFLVFSFVFAQSEPPTLNVGIPGTEFTKGTSVDAVNPEKFLVDIYTFLIGAVGIVAFVSLVVRGFIYMTSGVVDKKKDALEGIRYTFIGLFVALISWSLLNTISNVYVNVDFSKPEESNLNTTNNFFASKVQDFRDNVSLQDGYWYFEYDSCVYYAYNTSSRDQCDKILSFRRGPYDTQEACLSEQNSITSTPDAINKITKPCSCNGDLCNAQKSQYELKFVPVKSACGITQTACTTTKNAYAGTNSYKVISDCNPRAFDNTVKWCFNYYNLSSVISNKYKIYNECIAARDNMKKLNNMILVDCQPEQ